MLDSLITLAVALVCAAASFGHMYHVALLAGEPVWIARAWPVTVDGLVLAALRRGHEGRQWLALGIAVSMAANVLAQFPELAESAGPFVSAWPPAALYRHASAPARRAPPPRRRLARRQLSLRVTVESPGDAGVLSIGRMTAGAGYEYLTREVATARHDYYAG